MQASVKRIAVYAGLALGALLLWNGYKRHIGNDAVLAAQSKALEQRNARLEDEAGRIDTVYHTDTLRLAARRQRYEAARDTALRDPETTELPRAALILADSTIKACSVALQTCEARVALRDQRIAVLDSLLRIKEKQRPGWIRRTFGCAAGVAATTSGAGLGASCGVRFP